MTPFDATRGEGLAVDAVPSTHHLFEETVREHSTRPPAGSAVLDDVLLSGGSIVDEDGALWSAPPPPVAVPVSSTERGSEERGSQERGSRPARHPIRSHWLPLLVFAMGLGLTVSGVPDVELDGAVAASEPAAVEDGQPEPIRAAALPGIALESPRAPIATMTELAEEASPAIVVGGTSSPELEREAEPPSAAPSKAEPPSAEPSKAEPSSAEPTSDAATPDEVGAGRGPFDVAAAKAAVAAAARVASGCGDGVHFGQAVVAVTFAPTGRVTSSVVQGGPLLGTPVASCVAQTMRGVSLPAHADGYVTVSRTVTIR